MRWDGVSSVGLNDDLQALPVRNEQDSVDSIDSKKQGLAVQLFTKIAVY